MWKPKVALEKGWEPLSAYTYIGDCQVVIMRAGEPEIGIILKAVYWNVSNGFMTRGGTAKSWDAAVKAARKMAAELDEDFKK